MPLVARRHWAGQEHIPATGPAIVVGNHISNFDPLVLGEYLIYSGRWPRFLGKADIWRVPVLGWVAKQCQQIPVYRDTDRASDSLIHARKALERGQLIALYPEGTITADPDGWPMTGRRGALAPVRCGSRCGAARGTEPALRSDNACAAGIRRQRHREWKKQGGHAVPAAGSGAAET